MGLWRDDELRPRPPNLGIGGYAGRDFLLLRAPASGFHSVAGGAGRASAAVLRWVIGALSLRHQRGVYFNQ